MTNDARSNDSVRREMAWAEFDARVTSTPIKHFFQNFPLNLLAQLWKSSWLHCLPPSSPLFPPKDAAERPLVFVVALGCIQLWSDLGAAPVAERPAFAYKAGDRFYAGDSFTSDDLRRSRTVAAASPSADALVLELDQREFQRLQDLVRAYNLAQLQINTLYVPPDFDCAPLPLMLLKNTRLNFPAIDSAPVCVCRCRCARERVCECGNAFAMYLTL